jgi:integrase
VQEFEGRPSKRPFTREELQKLFDHADDEVELIEASGKKGWQAAYRDAVMLKVAYSYGLRFNELRHLQTVDFATNPHARKFGRFGVCKVRFGKSRRASPPKPRSVLTVFDWPVPMIICSDAISLGPQGSPLPMERLEPQIGFWRPEILCGRTAKPWQAA